LPYFWSHFFSKNIFYHTIKKYLFLKTLACSAGVFFGLANVFARESTMLKPKRGGNGANQRERGGGGEREEKMPFFLPPPPPPFPSFALSHTLRVALRVTISTLPNLPLS